MIELELIWLLLLSFVFEEEVVDDDEGDDVVEPMDLEVRIELTILLGTNHLSMKMKKRILETNQNQS